MFISVFRFVCVMPNFEQTLKIMLMRDELLTVLYLNASRHHDTVTIIFNAG